MDNPGPSILAFMILLIFSAFFSASETSLSSINRVRMKTRAEDGDKKPAKFWIWRMTMTAPCPPFSLATTW